MNQLFPQPGTILAGRYRVIRFLGRGGMGVVLEAKNIVTQRDVAIKWMLSDVASSAEATERLIREATAASSIQHPNVVDVYDVLQDGASVFLVMELLRGEPLATLIERGTLPIPEMIALLLPAMDAVAEAHRQDIIHRDIHPKNIFVVEEGRGARRVAKVLDFGISKLGGGDRPALTRSNISMGTPLYMSYEQLYSARDVDARADIYSFGVILYEALTGKVPFDAESFMELAGKIAAGNVVHPKVLRPEIPTALADVVMWAMARKREDRIPSMTALIRELEPFAGEPGLGTSGTASAPSPAPLGGRDAERIQGAGRGAGPAMDAVAPSVPSRSLSAPPPRSDSGSGRERPLAMSPLDASRGQVDTDGQVSRPLVQTVQRVSTAATSPRDKARLPLYVGSAIVIVLLAAGAWTMRTREVVQEQPASAAAKLPAVPQVTASQPSSPAPAPAPAPEAATGQAVAAGQTQPGGDAPMPSPTGPAAQRPRNKPAWMQRVEAMRAQGLQPPAWKKPVVAPAEPSPPKESRAGQLRSEDL